MILKTYAVIKNIASTLLSPHPVTIWVFSLKVRKSHPLEFCAIGGIFSLLRQPAPQALENRYRIFGGNEFGQVVWKLRMDLSARWVIRR